MEMRNTWAEGIFEKLDEKLSRLAVKSFDLIPYTTLDGKHVTKKTKLGNENINWWTNGFWGGLMWLMYSKTKKDCYLNTARHAGELLDEAWKKPEKLHHDVGFMFHISSGADFTLTGNEKALETALKAADFLLNRYNEKGDYIVAWNGEEKAELSIIDTMMNLCLLYWAGRQTGDEKYAKVAKKHADMAMREHIRPDGSVAHIVCHDTDSPKVTGTRAGQGYCEGSSWSRGVSWAVYGFTLAYIHTGEEKYLNVAKQTAHYFISQVALTDWLPLIDFRAPAEPVVYDSTAGAITACGLLEIAKCVPELEKKFYTDAAIRILKALEAKFCDWSDTEDGILLGGSERYGNGENMHIIYGDYYFTEAILKLCGNDFLPW